MKKRSGLFLILGSSLVFILTISLASFIFLYQKAEATTVSSVTINGKVYDEKTLEPINGALVTISAKGFRKSDRTDRYGRYCIECCPTDKELKITSTKAGYRAYRDTLPKLSTLITTSYYTYDKIGRAHV